MTDRPVSASPLAGARPSARVSVVRLAGVLAAAAGVAALAVLLLISGVHSAADLLQVPAQVRAPDDVIGVLARIGAAVLLGWLAAAALLAAVSALPWGGRGLRRGSDRWAARLAPRLLRSVIVAAVGGSLTLGAVSAASAVADPPLPPAAVSVAQLPAPGWTPAPPPAPPHTRSADVSLVSAAGTHAGADDGPVVVRRGDTLWAIAARRLGPGADAAQISREWPRWYAANRAVIGSDPDVLLPGQRLTTPTTQADR